MGHTILGRRSLASTDFRELNSAQAGMDAALGHFAEQAADPIALAAMSLGSFAFKTARLGFLEASAASGLSRIAPPLALKGAANLFALSAEVTAFRASSNALSSLAGRSAAPGTFDSKGWQGSFTDFLALKTIGHAAGGTNLALTHFAQANAMVLGHELSARLGFAAREEGSYIERLASAEASNLAMGAGMALFHRFAPRLAELEAKVELRSRALQPADTLSSRQALSLLASPPLPAMRAVENAGPSGVRLGQKAADEGRLDVWGEKLYKDSKSSWLRPARWRSPLRVLQDRILNEMLKDEGTKKRMIAFLDVATSAPDAALPELLRVYFPQGGANSRGLLRLMLNAGTHSLVPSRFIGWGVRLGLQSMAGRFLAGETPESAIAKARQWRQRGVECTLDVVQENVVSEREAEDYKKTVLQLIRQWSREVVVPARTSGGVPVRHVSVKLSGLTHRFEAMPHDWVIREAGKRLLEIFKEAKQASEQGAPVMVNVDLEDYTVRDLSYDLLWKTLESRELQGWSEVGVVVQSYYKESAETLAGVIAKARETGKNIQVRIVKGAYHSYEQIRSAANGWEVPVYLTQPETDRNFRNLASMGLDAHGSIRLAIGSHNLEDIAYVQAEREARGIGIEAVEHQFLLGVGNHLAKATARNDIPTRLYAPFGTSANGLSYMVRRLDEVKLNSAIGQTHFSGSWRSYRANKQAAASRTPPLAAAPAPTFANAPETDFSRASVRRAMEEALIRVRAKLPQRITPLIGSEAYDIDHHTPEVNVNPAHWAEEVSHIWEASVREARRAVGIAQVGYRNWSKAFDQAQRSAILNRAADLVHERQYDIAAHLVIEAGKPWHLALAEVHEGIDFLRSYALEALEVSEHREALGVGVAIAPFNFPFAIALGEVAGGLALGNAMILKPAEQTPASGRLLVEILREAGVPPETVQFVPGKGSVAGQALVEIPHVDFVVFTGSVETARRIMDTARLNPSRRHGFKLVVAETGGKNAMIVDETADLDVAVKAILDGAFLMSGQRCSATSRVFVVDSVADALLKRLEEGARSMVVGDPSDPKTQIGPQIDQASQEKVQAYLQMGKLWGEELETRQAHEDHPIGHYVGARIFTGGDPRAPFAQEEIFGPVLAVMRVKSVEEGIEQANHSPYGLTAGLISRHPRHIARFLERIEAGNAYVNRSQVGAMVRRQPFGGAKNSGTGPKAGGPQYVARFGRPKGLDPRDPEIAVTSTPPVNHFFANVFHGREKEWAQTDPATRLRFGRSVLEILKAPDGDLLKLSAEQRATLISRIERYLEQADTLLRPQLTLPVRGEINEEAHDWPQGTGLIWGQGTPAEDVISAGFAALLMGNAVILGQGPNAPLAHHLFANAGRNAGLHPPVFSTTFPIQLTLNDSGIDFIAAHGRQANNLFKHFFSRIQGKIGFRRAIGGHMDHPEDPLYLTRFASARTRSQSTLRHGAELHIGE